MAVSDIAIGQFLALAATAHVSFSLQDGRLAMHSSGLKWKLWPGVRHFLDEIGIEALEDYLRRTTPAERERLSATA